MKRLMYFRHSKKDGANNTLGPEGLALARKVGDWLYDQEDELEFSRIFHGPLVRTAQTALSFVLGFGFGGELMPVVPEIGDDELFKQMTAPSQFRALAGKMGNYRALCLCHDPSQINQWAKSSLQSVELMFDLMQKEETGVAFGHSPMIELAMVFVLGANIDLPDEYATFRDMEGVELQQDSTGKISVVRKISMPAEPAPAA